MSGFTSTPPEWIGWMHGARVGSAEPCPVCGAEDLDACAPSPEALPLRHGGSARILNSEDDHSTPDGAYVADEPVEEE